MPVWMTQLKHVDPNLRRSAIRRAFLALATTRPFLFLTRHISWKLDPFLLRITGGRLSSAVGVRTAVLETRGAKSGELRRNAVIYFNDGERVTIIPSNAGSGRNPAWFHNLLADRDVTLGTIPMRATVVRAEAERRRLWELADRVFPPFEKFRRNAAAANRTIPIVQLVPCSVSRSERAPVR